MIPVIKWKRKTEKWKTNSLLLFLLNVSALRWRGAASSLIASFIIGNGLEEQARWGRGEVGGERSTRREEGEWACLVRCGCLPRVGRRVQTLPSQHPGFNVQVHFSLRKAWGSGGLLTSYISVSFLENSADCVRRTLTWWILGPRAGPFHHRTCYPGSGRVIMAPSTSLFRDASDMESHILKIFPLQWSIFKKWSVWENQGQPELRDCAGPRLDQCFPGGVITQASQPRLSFPLQLPPRGHSCDSLA